MIADSFSWPSSFDKYILKTSDNSRLPLGQHTVFKNEDGYIGVFNNDYNPNLEKGVELANYKDDYSTATLYNIDKTNMTFNTVWEYKRDDVSFNYALGSFNYAGDNKLINYGWTFKQEAFDLGLNIFDYDGYTYSMFVELDDNDNVVFEATMEDSIYRAYKHQMYKEENSNYEVKSLELIDTTPYCELTSIKTSEISSQLDNAINDLMEVSITKTSLSFNVIFDILEDVKVVFVGEDDESLIFNYKPANEDVVPRINFNLKGKYALYIIINDEYYNLNKVVSFE